MLFKVNPSQTGNSLRNVSNRNAAYRQTDLEHEQALNYYVKPDDTPAERLLHLQQGVEREKQLEKYWDTDDVPRRDLNTGSSFIEAIRYVPGLRLARITMNGRTYSYPMTADEVGNMVNGSSLGEYYNTNLKRS